MKKALVIFLLSLFALGSLVLYQRYIFFDGKLHLVFCNVGQGDGIVIRTPKGKMIVVDGGPDDKILSCLSSHMPFWEKVIHLVILTHPHADHLNGLISVIKRYNVLSFDTENLENKTGGFTQLMNVLKKKSIPVHFVLQGDSFRTKDGIEIKIVGPSKEFLELTSPGGVIGESKEFGSVETLVEYGSFKALLTGDSQADELEDALQSNNLNNIDILQIPHHGSKTGINREIIEELKPKLAVISVGKNKYGHPSKETLGILRYYPASLAGGDIKILRTDQNGSIELVSDGKGFEVRK